MCTASRDAPIPVPQMSSFHTNPRAQEANAWLVDLFFTNGGNRTFHAHAAAYLKLSDPLPGTDALTSAMVKYGRTHDTKATLRKFMMVYHPDKNDDMEATNYMQILNLLKEIVEESKIPTFRLLFYCLYMYAMWRREGFCSVVVWIVSTSIDVSFCVIRGIEYG